MLDFKTNQETFQQFIVEHQNRVYNAILLMVQSPLDAEELTQDVFIEAYNNAAGFRGEAAVNTWLYRIAMNKSIDYLRYKKRKKRFAFVTELFHPKTNEPIVEAASFVHPGVLFENKEKAAYLFKAIEKLPEKQKKVFILFELEQLSYKEISEVMNSTVSSVESLIFRAKQNLKKLLVDYYYKNI